MRFTLLSVALCAAVAAASPASDYLMGFAIGLESKIGNPSACIGDLMQISTACKNKLTSGDVEEVSSCMDELKTIFKDCGFEQTTVGRVKELFGNPIGFLEARAKLLIGNPEVNEDYDAGVAACASKDFSTCGASMGKFIGLLVEAPTDLPSTSDGHWIAYVLVCLGACVVAHIIFTIVVDTFAFIKDIAVPCFKIVLIIVLWIVLILLVNKLDMAALVSEPEL